MDRFPRQLQLTERRLLIVYYSRTGGTEKMARAAHEGAVQFSSIRVSCLRASAARAADVLAADGFIFAAPENLASMAGVMKAFFDDVYYAALDRIAGRPYLCMVCAGSDGQGAARQIERIALGWRLRAVADALIVSTNAQSAEAIAAPKQIDLKDLQRCREAGALLAAGLEGGMF